MDPKEQTKKKKKKWKQDYIQIANNKSFSCQNIIFSVRSVCITNMNIKHKIIENIENILVKFILAVNDVLLYKKKKHTQL